MNHEIRTPTSWRCMHFTGGLCLVKVQMRCDIMSGRMQAQSLASSICNWAILPDAPSGASFLAALIAFMISALVSSISSFLVCVSAACAAEKWRHRKKMNEAGIQYPLYAYCITIRSCMCADVIRQ